MSNPKAFPTVFMDYIPKPEHQGMDLRDYFAAKALTGLLTEASMDYKDDAIAELAYSLANAMMKARELCSDTK